MPSFFGNFLGPPDQSRIIRATHVGKTRPEGFQVGAGQGIGRLQVDVIVNDHQITLLVVEVHASGGIGNVEGLDAQLTQNPDREGDLLHGIAFVIVKAALHGHNFTAIDISENEFSEMALNGAERKVRNEIVSQFLGYIDLTHPQPPRPVPSTIPTSGSWSICPLI